MENFKGKKVTLVDVARLAGTSKSTVSRVLLNQPRVSQATRERVMQVVQQYNYKPSFWARGLRGSKTGLIGVVGRWLESGFSAEVIRGINAEVQKNGGHLLVSFAPSVEDYIELWRSLVTGGQVDGVILVAPPMALFEQEIYATDKPSVLCAAKPTRGCRGWENTESVTLDNRTAMTDLMEHLLERKCLRIQYLAGPPDNFEAQERIRLMEEFVRQQPEMTMQLVKDGWTRDMARECVREYCRKGIELPDVFVGFNDVATAGIMEALRENHVRIPEDVCVAGWDDTLFASFAEVTTVQIPMISLGECSARMLYNRLSKGSEGRAVNLMMDQPLLIRRTTVRN